MHESCVTYEDQRFAGVSIPYVEIPYCGFSPHPEGWGKYNGMLFQWSPIDGGASYEVGLAYAWICRRRAYLVGIEYNANLEHPFSAPFFADEPIVKDIIVV